MAEDHAMMLIIAVGLIAVVSILLHDVPLFEKAPIIPPPLKPESIAPSCSYCGTVIIPGGRQASCLGCGAPITPIPGPRFGFGVIPDFDPIEINSRVPPPGPESVIIRSTPVNERLIETVRR